MVYNADRKSFKGGRVYVLTLILRQPSKGESYEL